MVVLCGGVHDSFSMGWLSALNRPRMFHLMLMVMA
jgi:hypothetical protein